MTHKILFVDDDQTVISSLKREVMGEEFESLFASGAEEALELLAKEEVHVIVSDLKMPKTHGLRLLKQVKEEYPKVIRIILSGYVQVSQLLPIINQISAHKFIKKPWDHQGLITTLKEGISLYRQQQGLVVDDSVIEKKNDQIRTLKNQVELDKLYHIQEVQQFKKLVTAFYDGLRTELLESEEEVSKVVDHYKKMMVDFLAVYPEKKTNFPARDFYEVIEQSVKARGLSYQFQPSNESYYDNMVKYTILVKLVIDQFYYFSVGQGLELVLIAEEDLIKLILRYQLAQDHKEVQFVHFLETLAKIAPSLSVTPVLNQEEKGHVIGLNLKIDGLH